MDTDDEMLDVEQIPAAAKGKGKVVDSGPIDAVNLPWYAFLSRLGLSIITRFTRRVEKYRPVTLDDVVSHKYITTTSSFFALARTRA